MGAGHSVSISVESGSFVLKPSDQFVGNKLDLILKQDAEGNYRFDSSQHNKGIKIIVQDIMNRVKKNAKN